MAKAQGQLGSVLVLGMGVTGPDVARYLAARLGGRVSAVTLYGGASSKECDDAHDLRERGVNVVLGTEGVEGCYDLCIASPGIPEHSAFFQAAQRCSREVISEPEFAWRESPERWLAITGTNGKTTTTTLATELLRAAGMEATAVGNIGNLATKAVDGRAEEEWFVAELSSFQLAPTRLLHPRAAVLLNVTPDHLAWHGSLEAYAAAKEHIFANLAAGELAIICPQDPWCAAIAERLVARGVRTCLVDPACDRGGDEAAFVRAGRLVVRARGVEHELVAVSDLRILGDHNLANALAASALALEAGAGDADVCRGLAAFAPLEHRVEPCGELAGVAFVNDSKATNTDAVEKALASFEPRSVVLLAGGHDKGTDLSELAGIVAERCSSVVCFGDAGPRLAEAMRAAAAEGPLVVQTAPHMADALPAACKIASAGQTILLSPACSSFDEFSSFEERGRVFKQLVADIIAAEGVR